MGRWRRRRVTRPGRRLCAASTFVRCTCGLAGRLQDISEDEEPDEPPGAPFKCALCPKVCPYGCPGSVACLLSTVRQVLLLNDSTVLLHVQSKVRTYVLIPLRSTHAASFPSEACESCPKGWCGRAAACILFTRLSSTWSCRGRGQSLPAALYRDLSDLFSSQPLKDRFCLSAGRDTR